VFGKKSKREGRKVLPPHRNLPLATEMKHRPSPDEKGYEVNQARWGQERAVTWNTTST